MSAVASPHRDVRSSGHDPRGLPRLSPKLLRPANRKPLRTSQARSRCAAARPDAAPMRPGAATRSAAATARLAGIGESTLRKAMTAGRVIKTQSAHPGTVNVDPEPTTKSQRSRTDAQAAAAIGTACSTPCSIRYHCRHGH